MVVRCFATTLDATTVTASDCARLLRLLKNIHRMNKDARRSLITSLGESRFQHVGSAAREGANIMDWAEPSGQHNCDLSAVYASAASREDGSRCRSIFAFGLAVPSAA